MIRSNLFTRSTTDVRLGCLQFVTVTNNAPVYIVVHVSWGTGTWMSVYPGMGLPHRQVHDI